MSRKLTKSQKNKKKRLVQNAATTQNTLKYTSNFESGLMHIVDNEYSKMFELGNLDYGVASEEDKLNVVVNYAEALNTLDKQSRYQMLVLNKRVKSSMLENILLPPQGDSYDIYRSEINDIITDRFMNDQKSFERKRFAIFSTHAKTPKQADRQLDTMGKNFKKRFEESDNYLDFNSCSGVKRMKVMSSLLRPGKHFSTTYRDIALSGLTSKAFVAPGRIKFYDESFKIDDKYGKVMYIRDYPENLEDRLINEICETGHELAISIHAKPYDIVKAKKDLNTKHMQNKTDIVHQQKKNFKDGLSEDMVSGLASEVDKTTKELAEEMRQNGQRMFSGVFTVMLIEETKEKLNLAVKDVKEQAQALGVEFDDVFQMQEEALNTILPIGKPYLDVQKNYMRDMTTSNIATQIPFTNTELQSPTGKYYGQNQLSNNIITIDRKRDLNTPSGLIFGTSGSGKGMTAKWGLIYDLLTTIKRIVADGAKKEHCIIVDPEDEYSPIGKVFGAEILDISSGTNHHLNILDMADSSMLDAEDRKVDLVKEKANLLVSLFESILKNFSDEEASMVDRVTRLTYQRFENIDRQPTLVDWYEVLKEQPESFAQQLVIKVEPYTIGSQDIFAHETNIDLTAPFIIFNIKHLDDRLKAFAMKVILDQVWKQVVSYQNKLTIHLYFDELQLNFDTEQNASWFFKLWSRIRKYGAVTTGITQNVGTLLEKSAGQKMISNSEFIVLLRQKLVDMDHLKRVIKIPVSLQKYAGERVPKGTGLIYAGGNIVPFENHIPEDTKLFELMNTDAA